MKKQNLVTSLILVVFLWPWVPYVAFGAIHHEALNFEVVVHNTAPIPFGKPVPYEFAAADLDLDGDTDLVVNWHLNGLELYRNDGNSKFNRVMREENGLYQQGGVLLYAWSEEIIAYAKSSPGIYLWHDPVSTGSWHIYISPGVNSGTSVELSLRSNELIEKIDGVQSHELERDSALETRDDAWALLRLNSADLPRHITFITKFIGSNIQVNYSGALPFVLGKTFVTVQKDSVSLRMADPHAMAWVNVTSTEHPDLFVARGGNRGRLRPPFEAKRNRFFVATGEEIRSFELMSDPLVPVDYGRGRSVAWVDIDGDRQNELYLGNKTSSNALLVYDNTLNIFQDMSSKFGLGLRCGDAFTWLDINGDGYDDLVFMTCFGSVAIAINDKGEKFSIINAEDYGIVLGSFESRAVLFESTSINSFDFDADGDLDIIVSGLGNQNLLKVFRNTEGLFQDVTDAVGLAGFGSEISIATDIDADGFLDLLSGGRDGLYVYQNVGGRRFTRSGISVSGIEQSTMQNISAIAVADFDGDGMKDIVVGTKGNWSLLKNNLRSPGKMFQITMRYTDGFEPIGAVVRAHYANGKILAQRYGSADLNGLSQFVFPLTFGESENNAIQYFSVKSPGAKDWKRIEMTDKRVVHSN